MIPNFVDVESVRRVFSKETHRRFAPSGEKVVVHLSNFRPVKRTDNVIRIFHRIQREIPARAC